MRSSSGSSRPHPDLYGPLAIPLMPTLRIIDGMIAVERDRADRALAHAGGSPPLSGDIRMRFRIRAEADSARSR